jgi:hypothetical protein
MLRSNPKRAEQRREKAGLADPAYLAWCRLQRCVLHAPACKGPTDPNHVTYGRGLGQKSDDRKAFPLCRKHHEDFHAGTGYFEDWDRDKRRDWQRSMSDSTRAFYESGLSLSRTPPWPKPVPEDPDRCPF